MAIDNETERQLDELRERLEATRRIRNGYRRRREALQEQAARLGHDAPPHVTNEIADLLLRQREQDAEIGEVEKRIARLELAPQSAIEVLPDGDIILPQLAPAVVDSRLQLIERIGRAALDGVVAIDKRLDARDALDREWRQAERAERRAGQSDYRLIFLIFTLALLLLGAGLIAIAVKVY